MNALAFSPAVLLSNRDPAKRLGCGPDGVFEILDHPFFAMKPKDFSVAALRSRKQPAPWVPPLKSETDAKHFPKVTAAPHPVPKYTGSNDWCKTF